MVIVNLQLSVKPEQLTAMKTRFAREGYSPDGTKTIGFQSGTWAKAGINTWSLKMIGKDSREGGVSTESQISLETLTWSGTVYRA